MASKAPKRAVEEEGVVDYDDFESGEEYEEEEDHTTRDIVPRSQGIMVRSMGGDGGCEEGRLVCD